MPYPFKQIFAADPSNPDVVAGEAEVLIFAPGDVSRTPLAITDPTGIPLPNPIKTNEKGFASAFIAAIPQVAWEGAGLTGFMESFEGMRVEAATAAVEATSARQEATQARTASESAASNAASAAIAEIGTTLSDARSAVEASAQAAQAAANLVGAPVDTAIATAIQSPGTQTNAALSATIADRLGDMGQRTSKLSMVPSTGIFESLAHTRSKVAGLRAGTGTLKVLCIGDSTTHGNDSTKSTGPWNTTSWPTQAAQILTDDGYKAQSGLGIAPSYASVGIDGRWALGAGWSQLKAPDIGWGSGVCVRTSNASTATGSAVFTPGTTYDKVDIYYTISSNAGFQAVLDVIVDGVTLGQINNSGVGGVGKTTFSPASATSGAVTIDPVSGAAIYILAVDCYTANGVIRLGNAGVAGSTTFDWKNDNGGYASLDCIRAYAPDLTIINLGINDSGWTPARAASGLIADLTTIGTTAATSGDVILTSFAPSAANSDKDATVQPSYWVEIRKLAAAKGWGYVNLASRYGNYEAAAARGWMSDLVHPNAAGYRNMAYAVADTLEAVMDRS